MDKLVLPLLLLLGLLLLLPDADAATQGCRGKPRISNGRVRCTRYGGCKAKCYRGYEFASGIANVLFKCVDGEYEPETGEEDYDLYQECVAKCDPPCGNGGTCSRPNHCECTKGWHGETCQEAHCEMFCGNGQICIAPDKCGCPEGKTGPMCEKVMLNNPGDELLEAIRTGDMDSVKTLLNTVNINYAGGEDKNSGLHECAIHNRTEIAEFLLNNGAQVDLLNKPGHTPLLVSAKYNTAEVAKILLRNGAALELKNTWGNTPLLKAVFYNSIDVVRVLLNAGASLRATQSHGKTPLAVSLERNYHNVTRLLIGKGYDLIGAVRKGDMEDVRRSLNHVNIDYAGPPQSNTALHESVIANNIDIMKVLLQNNATVDLRNRGGINALNLAMDNNYEDLVALLEEYHLMDAVRKEHVSDVRLFLNNVDINYALPVTGNTALHEAAKHNRPISARMLLEHAPDIHKVNAKGHTPLHTAVEVDAKEVIHILLMARSEDNSETNSAMSTEVQGLLNGIRNGQPEVVSEALEKIGINSALGPDGNTALHFASIYGQTEIAKLLIDSKADVDAKDNYDNTPLHDAAIHDRPEMAKLLLSRKAEKNSKNNWDETPLMTCMWANSPHVLKPLLENEANPSVPNDKGQTPREVALNQGHYDLVRLLDGKGEDLIGAVRIGLLEEVQRIVPLVNINYAGPPDGNTALLEAAMHNQPDIAEMLLENGALSQKTNTAGDTPLHLAAENNVFQMIKSLIKYNSKTNLQNRRGKTPVELAKDLKNWEAMRLIQGKGYDLIGAVIEGDIEKVREIIPKVNINFQGPPDDNTAVHESVIHNRPDILALLIESGADVEIWNKIGNSVLHKAAIHNQVEIAKVLISHGASAILLNDEGNAPLHEAAINNNAEMVTYLIEHGAPIDELNYFKDTPLMKAVRFKSTKVVRILLDHNATITIRDTYFQTPFELAQWKRSPEIIEMLAECHMMKAIQEDNFEDAQKYLEFINVNFTRTPEGLSPLHQAAIFNRADTAELLIRNWANVDIKNIHDSTPLHDAAVHNSGEVAKILLFYNASVDIENEFGNTPLQTAMEFDASEVVLALMLDRPKKENDNDDTEDENQDLLWAVRKGDISEVEQHLANVDINYSGPPDGNTGLHEAAVHDNLEIAELLIGRGIEIDKLNTWGMTALQDAALHNSKKVAEALIRHGAALNLVETKWGNSPLMTAAWSNASDVFLVLMEAGADMDVKDNDGMNALQLAEIRKHHKIVRLIKGGGKDLIGEIRNGNLRAVEEILNNADVNYAGEPDGNTGLHEASVFNHVEIATLLLEKGAIVDAVNHEGDTPLHLAAKSDNIEMAAVLIENGASVQVKNKMGKTPLLAAVKHQAPDVVDLLLHYNSSITHWYMDGYTPLQLAKMMDNQEIINMLSDYVEPPVLNVEEEVILLTDISPDPIYGDITMELKCEGKENLTWRYPSIQNYHLKIKYDFDPESDWPYKSTFIRDKAIPEYTGLYTCSYQDVPDHNDTSFIYVHRDLKLHTQGVVVSRDLAYINPVHKIPQGENLVIYCLPTLPDLKVRLYKFNRGLWNDVTSQWIWNNKVGFTKMFHDEGDRDVYECRAQGYTYHASINIR